MQSMMSLFPENTATLLIWEKVFVSMPDMFAPDNFDQYNKRGTLNGVLLPGSLLVKLVPSSDRVNHLPMLGN